jgi:hypothetical protein
MTRFALVFFLFIFFFAATGVAQEIPEWEFFGGYSFQRSDVREYFKSSPILYTFRGKYASLNGWNASVTENVNQWFGGTLEISGHYKSAQLLGTTNRERMHSILYGPRFSYRKPEVIFFTHVLLGAAHLNVEVTPVGRPHASDLSFAMAAGGGLDKEVRRKTAIRFQAEYFRTNPLGTRSNGFRMSAGIILYLGERK